jgi:hypothetical protein
MIASVGEGLSAELYAGIEQEVLSEGGFLPLRDLAHSAKVTC